MLRGHPSTLHDAGSPAFVGRRLCHFSCNISTALDYEPVHEGEEAGLTVFMNEMYHYDLAVRLVNGQNSVVFRRTVGSLSAEQTRRCSEGPVVLRIEVRPEHFRFSIEQNSSEVIFMGSGETHLLSTEVAGGFTGVMLAMYAFGDNETTPALFDWFDYEVIDRPSSGG